ncbi:TM1802 family CRISPR-associated protein [Desulfobacca acetoxidans]
MLGAMRTLALDYLFIKLGEDKSPPDDLDKWYQELRNESPEKLFPFLVEDTEKIEKIYIIREAGNGKTAEIEIQEMRPEISKYLPFVKPSGSQGAQIGPVIKRSYAKGKGAGPSRKILNTTLKEFMEIAHSGKPWSSYFSEIVSILELPKIRMNGEPLDWKKNYESMLECVVLEIGPMKGTALITVKDKKGNFPGQRREYLEYLMEDKLAGDRYLTQGIQVHTLGICPLCNADPVAIFPNALKGAGINIKNVDREGAFPGIDLSQAWKGYALCVPCADLLYVYKNHVLKKRGPNKDITPFTAQVAGEKALIIPFSTLNGEARQELLRDVMKFIQMVPTDVEASEETLLDLLKEEKALLNLTFLWADLGQNLENVTGVLTDVPPSRLKELSRINEIANAWSHSLLPKVPLTEGKFDLSVDLSLKALGPLFFRPGGKKAQNANSSPRLLQLKRAIAAAVYHKRQIEEERFWDEIITTANYYWLQAQDGKDAYKGQLYEGQSKKGPYLTAAGWIRYLTWWIHYLRFLGVLPMAKHFYDPETEALKPYFGPESGIDSLEKAYAFLLGVLYGKVIEVQGARGVNVGANALTWLKRLTLTGKDLPELYIKIREKLMAYETEKSQKVRELIKEIGELGIKLGDPIDLSQTQTNYYLLLGQSMMSTILKKDSKEEE